MKTLRRWLALTALLVMAGAATAQINIPGTSVSFQLDNNEWRYLRTFKTDDGATSYYYCYIGEVLLDDNGDTVLPFLRIYVKDGSGSDLYELVYDRYIDQPYQSLSEWSKGDGLPARGGLGYEGIYTKPSDKRDYRFLMTYFKERRTAVEFRLETTRETYEEMEVKFKKILSSIK